MANIQYDNVIVFGPTGAVGSYAALEASRRPQKPKVWLAMRDPSKKIPIIEAEQNGNFERVKADLSDPESVKAAIRSSGAKAAFVYLIHTPGGVKPALEAMKEAGVEYVVLLSSFTIKHDVELRSITPDAVIPWVHAQAEIALEDLGISHVALRPGSFASNPFGIGMNRQTVPAEVFAYGEGKRQIDNIVPMDIGRVAGAVLVERQTSENKRIVYLFGPTLVSELEMCKIIKELSDREIKVVQQMHDEWVARMRGMGLPEPLINYFATVQKGPDQELYGQVFKQGSENITQIAGYQPTTFKDYVKSRGFD